jgi:hypothetical protein
VNSVSSEYGVSQESKSYLIHLVDLISKGKEQIASTKSSVGS